MNDFNASDNDWKQLCTGKRDTAVCGECLDLDSTLDLLQIVETPTPDGYALDLVFFSHDIFTTGYECKVIGGISNHKVVVVNLNVSALSPRKKRLIS